VLVTIVNVHDVRRWCMLGLLNCCAQLAVIAVTMVVAHIVTTSLEERNNVYQSRLNTCSEVDRSMT